MEGSEAWCKKPLFYSRACKFVNLGRASSGTILGPNQRAVDLAQVFSKSKKKLGAGAQTPLSREDVQHFCG
jgi:hypothetical protein